MDEMSTALDLYKTVTILSLILLGLLILSVLLNYRSSKSVLDKYASHIKMTMEFKPVKEFIEKHGRKVRVEVEELSDENAVNIYWIARRRGPSIVVKVSKDPIEIVDYRLLAEINV